MYYFYVLESVKTGRLYKGHSLDVENRLRQHNHGKTKSTKAGVPWALIYVEMFESQKGAIQRERYYKSFKGGKDLGKILSDVHAKGEYTS